MRYEFLARDEKDTERLASALAQRFLPGTVIALDGDLGAGKTRFTQAIAASMGVRERVNSPTFTLIKSYAGQKWTLYHMDAYRLSIAEAEELGLEEMFYGTGVCVVEWASLIQPLLPEERLEIAVQVGHEAERWFRLAPCGEPYVSWCETLAEKGVIVVATSNLS
jgi:tRNA threonylcarbamoyladenosine biosynthesis protein TsaE